MRNLKVIICLVISALLLGSCSSPSPELDLSQCTPQQSQEIKNHITKQIDAIAQGNWPLAYSLSAKSFQEAISLDQFKQVISQQYLFLIFNDGFGFGKCAKSDTGFNQVVSVDFQGKKRELSYELSLIDDRLGVLSANEIQALNSQVT